VVAEPWDERGVAKHKGSGQASISCDRLATMRLAVMRRKDAAIHLRNAVTRRSQDVANAMAEKKTSATPHLQLTA
jgi:hypothetical protein